MSAIGARREGLVDLDHRHVALREAGALERAARWRGSRSRSGRSARRRRWRSCGCAPAARGRGARASALDISRHTAAPSAWPDDVAAVMRPVGAVDRQQGRDLLVASCRRAGPDRRSRGPGVPRRRGRRAGTISSRRRSRAAIARWWLRSAQRSISSRVMPYSLGEALGALAAVQLDRVDALEQLRVRIHGRQHVAALLDDRRPCPSRP